MEMIPKDIRIKIDFGFMLSTSDVADLFDIYTGTVRSWTREGMPYVIVKSDKQAFRYDIKKIFKWIREHKVRQYRRFVDRYGKDVIKL